VPKLAADIVDAYIFRRMNGRVQFLLLQRHEDLPLGGTWQSVHAKVDPGETALDAAIRAVRTSTGLEIDDAFSADYINQFYDHESDTIILAPVFAFTIPVKSRITLGPEYTDSIWCEREEATARLLWTGQRWAVRHIDEVIGHGGEEAEYYRVK
jgi:dATP pyrophosphohydrolase